MLQTYGLFKSMEREAASKMESLTSGITTDQLQALTATRRRGGQFPGIEWKAGAEISPIYPRNGFF